MISDIEACRIIFCKLLICVCTVYNELEPKQALLCKLAFGDIKLEKHTDAVLRDMDKQEHDTVRY